MTMFKTPQEIVKMAESHFLTQHKQYELGEFSQVKLCSEESYEAGYSQCQKDIQEVCSDGFEEWIYKSPDKCDLRDFEKPNHNYYVAKEGYEAGKLSSMKELQEKDEEIAHLKSANQRLEEARVCHLEDSEKFQDKYQEAVKDIEWLLNYPMIDSHVGMLDVMRERYGLNKEEK